MYLIYRHTFIVLFVSEYFFLSDLCVCYVTMRVFSAVFSL